jgi:hypothetical protein
MNRVFTIALILVFATSSIIMVETAFAQSTTKLAVPEFTLKYIDESYDIPPTTTSSTDPYNGKVTTATTPGYHVDQRAIEVTVKNSLEASYYNFRYKGSYGDSWNYFPFNPNDINGYSLHNTPDESPPCVASATDYTIVKLYLPSSVPHDGSVDVQIQGLFGDFQKVHEGSIGAMMLGYNTTYTYYFTGQAGDWSSTQTVTIGDSQALTPSPATTSTPTSSPPPTPYSGAQLTEQEIIIGVGIATAVIIVGLGLLIYLIKRK